MNTATKIAAAFDHDGTCFELPNGQTMDDECLIAEGVGTKGDGDQWRYEFPDGSALTGNAAGWDIEGTHAFTMSSSE
jgi:hypothetical protein